MGDADWSFAAPSVSQGRLAFHGQRRDRFFPAAKIVPQGILGSPVRMNFARDERFAAPRLSARQDDVLHLERPQHWRPVAASLKIAQAEAADGQEAEPGPILTPANRAEVDGRGRKAARKQQFPPAEVYPFAVANCSVFRSSLDK